MLWEALFDKISKYIQLLKFKVYLPSVKNKKRYG
jgi:hypothetical protein